MMKESLITFMLALSLCAPGMAQTKGKPVRGVVNNTASSEARNDITWSASSGSIITTFYTIPPPITIDGETTDCTQPHLIKALKIAAAMIADPNEAKCWDCFSGGLYVYPNLSWSQKPSDEKRAQAERLKAEADRLEAESKRVQWVRAVLAGCEQ